MLLFNYKTDGMMQQDYMDINRHSFKMLHIQGKKSYSP